MDDNVSERSMSEAVNEVDIDDIAHSCQASMYPGWIPLITTLAPHTDTDVKTMRYVNAPVNHNVVQKQHVASIIQNFCGNFIEKKGLPDPNMDNDVMNLCLYQQVSTTDFV